MRIELASLEGGRAALSHSYSEGELDLADSGVHLISPPRVVGKIAAVASKVKVSGQVTARVEVECDRCLKPIEFPVDSRFEVEYISTDQYQAQQDTELTEEDLDLAIFDGEAIDIDALVAEEVLLAVPDHRLCHEDCKGICPTCGADRNLSECGCDKAEIDPRWAGLKKLVNGK
ncbi:MAG TPA: DUF177 domain-containing protein [Pyrinomonadaceae bacterium]|nr:DUF177 domain-containing protein [Pyrinomonadaceae bacterium]